MSATLQLVTADDVLASSAYADVASAGGGMTAEKRAFIEACCKAVSEDAERVTGRWFKVDTYTETLDVQPGARLLRLRAYPLDLSVAFDVRESATGQFASAAPLGAEALAAVNGGRVGQIALRSGAFLGGPQTVQVTYKGGLATDPNAVPDDLRLACVEQVVYIVRRAPNLHLASESQEGGATQYRSVGLLDSVRRVWFGFKRVR